jgi:hypothetical protein
MNRKPDDQDSLLGLRQQLAQHDAGVTRATTTVRTARDELDLSAMGWRPPL